MCGIIGMVASRDVVPFLVDGLRRMEYRGYDSAGIAIQSQNTFIRRRAKGKISALMNVVSDAPLNGNIGIGHIRWATHGAPTEANAHPHVSKNVALVHNGIIENWQELKAELLKQGFHFQSETDTEVIAHLIQSYLNQGLPALEAFQSTLKRIRGAYALAAMIDSLPNTLLVARLGSPLVIGLGNNEMYVGSDALALAPVTQEVYFLEDGDSAILSTNSFQIFDAHFAPTQRKLVHTGLTAEDTDKGRFTHFMQKEIFEQPKVMRDLIAHYIDIETHTIKPMSVSFNPKEVERMAFIACGTAYHSGVLGKYWMETLAKINVDVDFASEYRYRDLVQPKKGVFIAFSQSGETADTLAALRRAKAEGQHIASIVNVQSSTMARESSDVLPILAGTEIGVASTKAFTAQCFVVLCLAIWMGRQRGVLSAEYEQELVKAILLLPNSIETNLAKTADIEHIAKAIAPASDVLFLGRGRNYPIALEGALKLKEISYIHAEAYASGEMKHGAIALIDEHVPVVVIAPCDEVLEKSLSNMHEVAARQAQVILVAEAEVCTKNNAQHHIIMQKTHAILSPINFVIPLQLLAYYTALALGKDVDQPRNLAKSVTVE